MVVKIKGPFEAVIIKRRVMGPSYLQKLARNESPAVIHGMQHANDENQQQKLYGHSSFENM